ncbi:inositol monophosphatase family protein [Ferrimicrobium sp.]|uniref:inositol monophosphatase family protein n=1 Tax=Ferrimicrobium sp. TaxID=2926050 RepID=UPI002632B9A7|nr:inositol monophosphatase family protein [Ferrimicrobium sp.]
MVDPRLVLELVDTVIEETEGFAPLPREKAPGEWVTERDVMIESMMTARLGSLIHGSRVLGEESAGQDFSWSRWIARGPVWILDPLDGTANYVSGVGPVATMVALVVDGSPCLSCLRIHGGPALVADSSKTMIIDLPTRPAGQGARSRGMISSRFLPRIVVERLKDMLADDFDIIEGSGCAGSDYLDLVSGSLEFLVYERVLPWDHIPGAYAATIWGASARMGDGSIYLAQPEGNGLVVSSNEALTHRLLGIRQMALQAEI